MLTACTDRKASAASSKFRRAGLSAANLNIADLRWAAKCDEPFIGMSVSGGSDRLRTEFLRPLIGVRTMGPSDAQAQYRSVRCSMRSLRFSRDQLFASRRLAVAQAQSVDEHVEQPQHGRLPVWLIVRVAHADQRAEKILGAHIRADLPGGNRTIQKRADRLAQPVQRVAL